MTGLVVLDLDLKVVQEVAAVPGDAEEVDPGAVGAAGSPGGLCRPRPLRLTGREPAPLPARQPAGQGSRARWPKTAPRAPAAGGPSSARARARGSRTTRIVFSSGARYRPAIGSHGARSRARSRWLARLTHCPTAVNRSFQAVVNAQTATATRQASG